MIISSSPLREGRIEEGCCLGSRLKLRNPPPLSYGHLPLSKGGEESYPATNSEKASVIL